MASIKQLPESVWTRIAAGEVVERPASAVKELIENSLDAGARSVRVRLWDGGRLRIVVEDDGRGIAFADLPLALTPHATSKISDISDLDSISTLGYRGEALASLTAVASVEIRSRCEGEGGGIICSKDGKIAEHSQAPCRPGTRVQIDELFGNFPARRKFMKSASGELRRAASCVRDYAVCRPDVAFALEHDGRELLSSDGGGDVGRVLEKLWGGEQPIRTVWADVAHLSLECRWQSRPARGDVMAFVNGRAVNDPVIKGAVSAVGARELTGNWALFFTLDPSLVDVNIHPAKAEVRFRYSGEVFEILRQAASKLGGASELSLNGPAREGESSDAYIPRERGGYRSVPASMRRKWDAGDDERGESAGRGREAEASRFNLPRGDERLKFSKIEPPDFGSDFGAAAVRPSDDFTVLDRSADDFAEAGRGAFARSDEGVFPADDFEPSDSADTAGKAVYMGQASSGYLIFDCGGEIMIMDPHAAHERVNYERIRGAAASSESQHLLVPLILPPTLALEALEHREALERAGFALGEEGGGVFLRSVPSLPDGAGEPEALLRVSLPVLRGGGDINEALWRTWATMACKASVKLTSRLTSAEALALWNELHRCEQPYFCPHGRPVMLRIGSDELSRHFER